MEIEAHLQGLEPSGWLKAKGYLEQADFAQRAIVRYVLLPNGDDRVRFMTIRHDGRPSLLGGMSLEQFNDATPSQIIGMVEWTADTYQRGIAEPITDEQKKALGAQLLAAWEKQGPILFSVLPPSQDTLHVIDVLDHLSAMLEGQIDDEEMAQYLKFAGLGEIREEVREYFPEEYYGRPS